MSKNLSLPHIPSMPEAKALAESLLNKGMITAVHARDLPNGAVTLALNTRCRLDRLRRRAGFVNDLPTKPNANKILKIALYKENDGTLTFLRFTRNSIHRRDAASWTAFTAGTGGALTGGDNDRFSLAVVLRDMYFANGVDKIQKLDMTALTYVEAGPNAPKVKYVTGFFERIVGAHRVEASEPDGPVSLVWSAQKDGTKWPNDAPPHVSSGQEPLVESTSDLADFITGVFGGAGIMLVLREKSIWAATKTVQASRPFSLSTAVPGIGCDCPHSAVIIPGGLAFTDTRTSTVWAYPAGGTPERIGLNIEKELIHAIDDPANVFGSSNVKTSEYTVAIPLVSSGIVRMWTFNRHMKSWVYDEIQLISCIADLDSPFTTNTPYGELAGTIEDLEGTMEDLGVSSAGKAVRVLGTTTGEILEEHEDAINDAGTSFLMDIRSKEFLQPEVNTYFSRIRIEYICRVAGTLKLWYSTNDGKTWKLSRTKIESVLEKTRILIHQRHIHARALRWRLTTEDGAWDIVDYGVHIMPSGLVKT